MRIKILTVSIFIAFLVDPLISRAQVNTQDSLALVDLYNSTNGSGWINNTNWLTTKPVSSWFGIQINSQRVYSIKLINNKLVGNIPSSLGNITNLTALFLGTNQLSGNIPASLGNLTKLARLDLRSNQLSGIIPASLAIFSSKANFSYNNFTFSDLENVPYAYNSPQADIPLIIKGDILSVAAGGTLSNNTYKWYKDDSLVSTKTGDSSFLITSPGN
jgi:Leucine-rich repeat (LRR) protein